jgi:tRNA modification GTPase
VLDLVVKNGARLAQPGEFTKRAFLNGRIDLSQAESVLDIIKAKTDLSLRVALSQLEGTISRKIREMREELLDIRTNLEVALDFPDEDTEILQDADLLARLRRVATRMEELLDTSDDGVVLRDGVVTVICGRPNVGKSSLMNALIGEDRAIVTPVPGTTRDTIEEIVSIGGIPLRVVDTAGIAESCDLVEKEGIHRSRLSINRAALVLLVVDSSQELSREDIVLIDDVKHKDLLVVANKIDLPCRLDIAQIEKILPGENVVQVSALAGTNITGLKDAVVKMIWDGKVVSSFDEIITNVRHRDVLRKAHDSAMAAIGALEEDLPSDIVAVDVKETIDNLGEIAGETVTEDLLDRIFSMNLA